MKHGGETGDGSIDFWRIIQGKRDIPQPELRCLSLKLHRVPAGQEGTVPAFDRQASDQVSGIAIGTIEEESIPLDGHRIAVRLALSRRAHEGLRLGVRIEQ
jgi:hypothetical protein